MFLNRRRSTLLRLPDTALVTIMRKVDPADLLRLRHCSRDFMRLFSEQEVFRRHHLAAVDDFERYLDTARIWAAPRDYFSNQSASSRVFLCEECLQSRRNDIFGRYTLCSMPSLYCSRCKTMHKEMHFSIEQQHAEEDGDRICIGHEGSFQVCRELVISLHQVVARSRRPKAGPLLCWAPHVKCETNTCGRDTCPGDCRPVAECYQDKSGRSRVKISFACHITLQRRLNGKICPHALRKQLNRVSMRGDLGKSWGSFLPEEEPEMRAFDPNICDCVDWTARNGRDLPPRHSSLLPALPLASSEFRNRWRERAPSEGYMSESGRCAFFRHGFTLRHVGVEISVDMVKCHGNGDKDLLVLRRTIDCGVDPKNASAAGWADIVTASTYRRYDEISAAIKSSPCGNAICTADAVMDDHLHLRAEETKQSIRSWPRGKTQIE